MTTIVCTREAMAADSQVTSPAAKYRTSKLRRLPDGSILGLAGVTSCAEAMAAWLADELPQPPADWAEDTVLLRLTPDRRILLYDSSTIPFEIEDDFAAIGTGAAAALGAMHMGADLRTAIRIAAKIDPYTGGRIQVLRPSPK